MEYGFSEVADDVPDLDYEDSAVLLCIAKKPSSKAKTLINILNVRVRNELVLGDDQESFSRSVRCLENRFYPSHSLR